MTFSHSRLSFADCFKLFDEAVASEKGIKFPVKSRKQAYHMRNRLNHARRIDRKDNMDTYLDPSHPLHGRSVYDVLTVIMQMADGQWWLLIEKVEGREFAIQPITGDENNVEPELHNGGSRETSREETPAPTPADRSTPVNPPLVATGLRRL